MTEERGVAGDVFADGPEDAGRGGFGGACAEDLGAVDPDGGDAVVLLAGGGDGEIENGGGPGGVARGEVGGDWRRAEGVGEGVGEDGVGAGGIAVAGAGGEEDGREGGIEVLLRRRGVGGRDRTVENEVIGG